MGFEPMVPLINTLVYNQCLKPLSHLPIKINEIVGLEPTTSCMQTCDLPIELYPLR